MTSVPAGQSPNGHGARSGGRPVPPGAGQAGGTGWDVEAFHAAVREVLAQVEGQLEAEIQRRHLAAGDAAVRELAWQMIAVRSRDWVDDAVISHRRQVPPRGGERQLAQAVWNEIFGLGRLQPLLEDPQVENIDINGCSEVWISYADGRKQAGPPVADSDQELVDQIRRWGTYLGQTSRDFSAARPVLHLALPDGSRLAAVMAITPWPALSLRIHRLVKVSLDELVRLGTLSPGLREFLAAVVRARKNLVVTGGVAAGKTTLVRALAGEIDPLERIATLENEYELFLRATGRHRDVVPMESRTGNTEDGAGEMPLVDMVPLALRMNPRRIIVGEVRGSELLPMLEAMNTGQTGSLCTLHADSAREVFPRMLILARRGSMAMPVDSLYTLAGMAVDLVVHLDRGVDERGHPVRFVSEVLEVLPPADASQPATNRVYTPGADGRAMPATTPQCLDELVAAGFDPTHLDAGGQAWPAWGVRR